MRVLLLFFISCTLLFGEIFKPLTVLIDFPNYKYTDLQFKESKLINQRKGDEFTPELYENMFFNPEEYSAYNNQKLISARKYFDLESGETFILKGSKDDIYGWYRAPKPIEFYGKNMGEDGDRRRAAYLIDVALKKLVEDRVDFSKYDLNNDNIIDGLFIVYAGEGENMKNSLGSQAIWPHFNRIENISQSKYFYFKDHNNKVWEIDRYAFIPQDIPLDLYIHEIGHFLDLADLYHHNSTIGYWSIMGELYCGEIPGSKLNSFGGYYRYNLQNNLKNHHTLGFWAEIINFDLEEIKKEDQYVKLHNINHKKSNNLVKIKLPGEKIKVPSAGRDLYYTDNYLHPESDIIFSTFLPKNTDNILKFDLWFNSQPNKEMIDVYVRRPGEEQRFLLKNRNSKRNKKHRWIPLEFDLNQFNGGTVEILVDLLPYESQGPKGAYLSNLTVMSDTIKNFDLKNTKTKVIYNNFIHSRGDDLLKRYILMEYRVPVDKHIDEGLLSTKLNIPYRKGLLIWYVDESYSDFDQLVTIIPSNKKPLYEVLDGKLIELELKPYIVSNWTFSSLDLKEMGVIGEKRVFYRQYLPGSDLFFINKNLEIKILDEDKSVIKFIISYKH